LLEEKGHRVEKKWAHGKFHGPAAQSVGKPFPRFCDTCAVPAYGAVQVFRTEPGHGSVFNDEERNGLALQTDIRRLLFIGAMMLRVACANDLRYHRLDVADPTPLPVGPVVVVEDDIGSSRSLSWCRQLVARLGATMTAPSPLPSFAHGAA
jgi:hypothetical protein